MFKLSLQDQTEIDKDRLAGCKSSLVPESHRHSRINVVPAPQRKNE